MFPIFSSSNAMRTGGRQKFCRPPVRIDLHLILSEPIFLRSFLFIAFVSKMLNAVQIKISSRRMTLMSITLSRTRFIMTKNIEYTLLVIGLKHNTLYQSNSENVHSSLFTLRNYTIIFFYQSIYSYFRYVSHFFIV